MEAFNTENENNQKELKTVSDAVNGPQNAYDEYVADSDPYEVVLSGDNDYVDNESTNLPDTSSGLDVKQERWNPEAAMLEYSARNAEVAQKLSHIEDRLHGLVHIEEHDDMTETEINSLIIERERLLYEKIVASANYPGDWTGLLYSRLSDPVTKEKFVARRIEAMDHMRENMADITNRREMPKSHYQAQIDAYDETIAKVFSRTEVGPAELFGSRGRNLGNQGNEGVGAVFSDAEYKGVPLTSRQKNIIEAHEKGHCLRDFVSPYDRAEIQGSIDRSSISKLNAAREVAGKERIAPTYVSHPMEIIERMAQFKNYFAMGAADTFKKQHLDYIREHYVADTGLDNGVSDLLYLITPETEPAFLNVINTYPI